MRFENSKYFKEHNLRKVEFPFGNFYFCKHVLIAEIHEGMHFAWANAKRVVKEAVLFYGDDVSIIYLSNRVNSYSSDPYNWKKVEEKYTIIKASAIVIYNDLMLMNASLEKQFSNISFKKFTSLDEAMQWSLNPNEID